LILTATRTGAVIGGAWDEIDFDKCMWTIPGSREGTKIKDPNDDHRVPLTSEAIDLLRSLPREAGNPYLFIGGRRGKPLSNMALNETVKQMNSERQRVGLPMYVDPKQNNRPIVPHGFRSTFRDWAAERTNCPNHVVEMAMAHVIGNKVEAAYRRGDLLQKRVRLMSDWARYCTSPAPAGEVVSLAARRTR
jgi:integrase